MINIIGLPEVRFECSTRFANVVDDEELISYI